MRIKIYVFMEKYKKISLKGPCHPVFIGSTENWIVADFTNVVSCYEAFPLKTLRLI